MNLAENLSASASERPDAVAMKLDDLELTYAQLDDAAARVAGLLRAKGVGPGDRVGIMLPNVPYFPVVYYGVLRAGGVVVPMNVLLKGREVAFYLARLRGASCSSPGTTSPRRPRRAPTRPAPSASWSSPASSRQLLGRGRAACAEVAERADDDTAVILYTSGTTGTPKGAELTHANLRRNVEARVDAVRRSATTTSSSAALPLFHSFGQTCGLNAAIAAGGMLTLIPRFDPAKALEIIAARPGDGLRGRADDVRGDAPPPRPRRASTSRRSSSASPGGAAMPVEVLRGFEEAFGCKILEGYGLSETSPVASFNHPDRERKPGSIGTPIEGVEMKVVDDDGNEVPQGEVGEIVDPRPQRDEGLLEPPRGDRRGDRRDGWFRTGDMATVDEDGYFFIVDRKKDLIIRGGYNVYPREIEEVLYEHPAVREAAVVGVPHDELGEEVGAAVALKDGAEVERGRAARLRQGRRSPPTSTRAASGSSTSCPRARPARSSSAR